jgi:pimeloyl-ACP methyl ester carboxylesterase
MRIRSSFATFPQIGAMLRLLNAWRLKDITHPVLIVHGNKDIVVMPSHSGRLVRLLPACRSPLTSMVER